jgi:copper homeostasis protein (lipoprotein)
MVHKALRWLSAASSLAWVVACAAPVSPDAGDAVRRLSGHYTYLADAGTFTDCASGQRMAVAQEGDNVALQRAYLAARPAPAAPMLITVDARVRPPQVPEGGGQARPVLVVERFVAIAAGPCGTPHASAALQDTYWKLVQLHGQTIADAAERQREAHLVLHTAQQRLAGSGGCNRLAGSYTLDGPLLSFGRTAATRMACAQGMAQEQALLDALAATARWRIDAQRLELLDAQGASLARFEAVALR